MDSKETIARKKEKGREKEHKKRNYGIYLNANAVEAYYEFLKILNEETFEKDDIEIDMLKDKILEELKKRGHDISKSSIMVFLNIATQSQKSRRFFNNGRYIAIR